MSLEVLAFEKSGFIGFVKLIEPQYYPHRTHEEPALLKEAGVIKVPVDDPFRYNAIEPFIDMYTMGSLAYAPSFTYRPGGQDTDVHTVDIFHMRFSARNPDYAAHYNVSVLLASKEGESTAEDVRRRLLSEKESCNDKGLYWLLQHYPVKDCVVETRPERVGKLELRRENLDFWEISRGHPEPRRLYFVDGRRADRIAESILTAVKELREKRKKPN